MSLQELFAEAKLLKEIIQRKTAMIEIINRDMADLTARREEERQAVENARAALAEIKTQLNSKIANEEWDDIVRAQQYTVEAAKKGLNTYVKTTQSFLKKMKILS